ncbi:hypothetical protein ABPG72_008607 [Tetrahymena utriculariae]
MNKKLIIIALVLAFTIAKFDFKQKMIENASSLIHQNIKDFLSQENLSEQDLEQFARNNNLDIEKLTKIYQWKQKKANIENAPELTEEQKEILKEKFMQLRSQNLSFEEIKSQMKQFAEQNGINLDSIKKNFRRHHQMKHREQSSEEQEDNEIQLTPEQIELIKNKFKELKKSGISMEEIKKQMRSFAESNNINPEELKKLCRKHREEQRRKEKGFLHNKRRDESESSSESQSEEEQNGQKRLKLGKHDNQGNQNERSDERQNNFEKRQERRRGQLSEERKSERHNRQDEENREERGNRHHRDERSEENRKNRDHEERRDRRHNQDREDKNDRRQDKNERRQDKNDRIEDHRGKHQREDNFERIEDNHNQHQIFEISEEFDF